MKKLTKKQQEIFNKNVDIFYEENKNSLSYLKIYDIMEELVTIEHSLQALNINDCNYGLSQRQETRRENLENKAIKLIEELGFKGDTQRDPRGWSILVYLPSKKFNSFDGETYRIGIY